MRLTLSRIYQKIKFLLFWRKIKSQIGKGSVIDSSVHVLRWRNFRVGADSIVCEGTAININDYSTNHISMSIGDRCFVGRRNFFSVGASIQLSDYVMTGVDCHFLGAGHEFSTPLKAYLFSGTTVKDNIKIGVNTWLGARVTILGNVRIGHGCVIGAGSFVRNDIPPFCIATGNPAVVKKRFNFKLNSWESVNSNIIVSDTFEGPNEVEYLEALNKTHNKVSIPYPAAGKDMGDRW